MAIGKPPAISPDPGKIENLLDKLHTAKHGLPVATSSSALKRFKVSDDEFERRVILHNENNLVADLYIGSGAGARHSNVPRGKDTVVYSAVIGSYDAPVDEESWQDKSVLRLDQASINAIELADLSLQRSNATE